MTVTAQTLLRVLAVFLLVRAIENASTAIALLFAEAHAPRLDFSVMTLSLDIPIFIGLLLWFLAPVLGATIDSSVKRPPPIATLRNPSPVQTTSAEVGGGELPTDCRPA